MNATNSQPERGPVDSPPSGRASSVGQFLIQAQRSLLSARFIGHADLIDGHDN